MVVRHDCTMLEPRTILVSWNYLILEYRIGLVIKVIMATLYWDPAIQRAALCWNPQCVQNSNTDRLLGYKTGNNKRLHWRVYDSCGMVSKA